MGLGRFKRLMSKRKKGMTMLSCKKYRKRLNAYLDGELPARKKVAVERHLAACQSCRTVLQSLRDLGPALLAADVPAAPTDLTSRIMAEAYLAKRRGAEKPSPWRTQKPLFTGLVLKGGDMRQPMAVAAIGGLGMEILVALFLMPCLYAAVSRRVGTGEN